MFFQETNLKISFKNGHQFSQGAMYQSDQICTDFMKEEKLFRIFHFVYWWNLWKNWRMAYFTDNFYLQYDIALYYSMVFVSLPTFPHPTTTKLLCHVKNVAIIWLKCGWLQSDISVEMRMTANRYFRRIWDTRSIFEPSLYANYHLKSSWQLCQSKPGL